MSFNESFKAALKTKTGQENAVEGLSNGATRGVASAIGLVVIAAQVLDPESRSTLYRRLAKELIEVAGILSGPDPELTFVRAG